MAVTNVKVDAITQQVNVALDPISVVNIGAIVGASSQSISSFAGEPLDFLARDPDSLIVGGVTRSSTEAVIGASIVWPDGTAGTFVGTESSAFPGAVDSYYVTYGLSPSIIHTYTQPTVTRDSAGGITNRPAIVTT